MSRSAKKEVATVLTFPNTDLDVKQNLESLCFKVFNSGAEIRECLGQLGLGLASGTRPEQIPSTSIMHQSFAVVRLPTRPETSARDVVAIMGIQDLKDRFGTKSI